MDDRMKLKIVYLAIAGVGLALLTTMSSCSKQNIVSDKKITCTPDSFMLLPDSSNQAALNLQVHIPKHYFSKRSRLFVIPVLTDSDSIVAKYKPIVLDAPIYRKKMERKWVLDSIADPYNSIAQRVTNTKVDFSVLYNDTITLPANFHKGSLVAVASADGCGECRAISHTKIADVFRPEIKKQLHLNWMKHTFEIKPKIRERKGVARLEFAINKYDINLKMSNNQAELDHMLSDIAPVLSDSLATLTSLGIYGLASADGPLKFNTPLSRNRANSALKWLLAHIENAAKRFKNKNESRIRYLQRTIKNATVIDDSSADDEVGVNNTVEVLYEDDESTETIKIVTTIRADSLSGMISIESPLGKALLGHKKGDRVLVQVNPQVEYYVVIKSISNTDDSDDNITSY